MQGVVEVLLTPHNFRCAQCAYPLRQVKNRMRVNCCGCLKKDIFLFAAIVYYQYTNDIGGHYSLPHIYSICLE